MDRKTTGKTFDDFDGFARDYRQIHNESLRFSGADSDYFSEQKVQVVRDLEPRGDLDILDLGCGDGNSARYFSKHFPAGRYSGLDTSEQSIEIARARDVDGADFLCYDGENLPFPDVSFDLVFIACVMHHIDHAAHPAVLNEVKRVLRPGGRLYIFEHNPINPLTRRVVNNCPFDEDAVLLPSGYTRRTLRELEFSNIEIGYTVFFPNHKIFRGLYALEPFLRWLPLGGQYYARAQRSKGVDE